MALVRLGGGVERTSGHSITATPGVPQFHMEIDTIQDGETFCNPVDASAVHMLGNTYRVAVCVKDPPAAIGYFEFELVYDDTLNQAPEVADYDTSLDDNPDGNAGTTVWLTSAGDYLGGAWDCSGWALDYPRADIDPETGPGHGRARIVCRSLTGPWMLGDDETEGVLATVQFEVVGTGVDTLHLENVAVHDMAVQIGSCNPYDSVPIPCFDATDEKTTPTATATPGPVGGIAELPVIDGTSHQKAGAAAAEPGWPSRAYAALAGVLGAAVIAITAGAWHAGTRRGR